MNKNRHNPNGKYDHVCAVCGLSFKDNSSATRYCSFTHKQQANNRIYYRKNSELVIAKIIWRRRGKKPVTKIEK